jgi:metal-responsive CopG/Arc/MetJ family transcriptional regulator
VPVGVIEIVSNDHPFLLILEDLTHSHKKAFLFGFHVFLELAQCLYFFLVFTL